MIRKDRSALMALTHAVGFAPHPGQVKILEGYLKHRFLCIVCGRRYGKTYVVSILAAYVLMQRDGSVLAMSKTYKLANKMWKYLVRDIRKILGATVSINNAEKTMSTPWGSCLELGTASNPDSLLGDGYDLVIGDEAVTLDEIIHEQNLMPAVRDKRGTLLYISTPRGFNWIYDLYEQGQRLANGWWSTRGISRENYHVWDDEEWDLAMRQSDPQYFQQEYLAEFVTFADQVYDFFTPERNVLAKCPDLTGWDHYVVIDPGYRKAAILWAAHNRVSDELVFYKEHVGPRVGNEKAFKLIHDGEPAEGYKAIISDVAGNARTADAGHSIVTFLNEQEWMIKKGYYVITHDQGVTTGINLVKSRILNAKYEVRLFVVGDACPELTKMHHHLMYEPTRDVYIKDNIWDHAADAERYLVYHLDRAAGSGVQIDL